MSALERYQFELSQWGKSMQQWVKLNDEGWLKLLRRTPGYQDYTLKDVPHKDSTTRRNVNRWWLQWRKIDFATEEPMSMDFKKFWGLEMSRFKQVIFERFRGLERLLGLPLRAIDQKGNRVQYDHTDKHVRALAATGMSMEAAVPMPPGLFAYARRFCSRSIKCFHKLKSTRSDHEEDEVVYTLFSGQHLVNMKPFQGDFRIAFWMNTYTRSRIFQSLRAFYGQYGCQLVVKERGFSCIDLGNEVQIFHVDEHGLWACMFLWVK